MAALDRTNMIRSGAKMFREPAEKDCRCRICKKKILAGTSHLVLKIPGAKIGKRLCSDKCRERWELAGMQGEYRY